ncbi:helix-turn-helix domain-containing protein [Clostridium perfringens]|jgi:SOS-response transcriptional repressor LexA|uniref:Helix-turn-helix domain-containing protein n=10 Tax=Clostridium perfringens TaxID=1502 RepID=Q1PLJ5_CLOPF|nr:MULTISPECIES: S24 family peptidase [Bacillota]MDU7817021.1 S24 family peptidase [Bacillota bacterium]ABC96282.1 probable transcriptional regulator [Clostridium perfringens]AEP95064.1 putative transcription regulator [Clostridium perfringens]AQW28540.1 LexA family transcriptional regulator [Clostridium perfringens]AWS27246.1 helix-turn-helix domain-containing protein [Clostridium perfringens]
MIEIELHNLALNIKEFRKKNKLSQAELAEKLGVARTTIGYYERAEVEPNIYTLVQLSKLMNRSIDSLLGLNHPNETTNDLNNSDLSKKIFILNKLIEKNTQSFNDLETSKLRTERMFNELQMSKKRTERMFNELKRTRNRAENDIKLFQELSKEFTNTLDKEHETDLSDALEYQDINYNFSTTEKEDFLSSNLKDLISNLNFIPIDVVGEVSCGTPSYAFNEISKSIALPSNYKDCFALRVKGNSMNKLFKDNELIICCRNKTPIDGDIVIAYLSENNEATCKKIHKKKDKLELHPCSTLPYEIQYYDKNSDINIIGVVLGSLNDILDLENIDIEDLEEKLNTI